MKNPKNCIQVFRDGSGEYRWRAVARNGRIIADGAEGYKSRSNATRAALRIVNWILRVVPEVVSID
jgi:uncharacterized protein YegP (UPF0339 family)